MTQLFEKYRPREWSQVVGQDDAVKRLLRLRDRVGFGGRAYWITGSRGTGKTTIAKLIANEVASDYCIHEIVGDALNVDRLEELLDSCRYRAFGKGGHAFIINEAHGISHRVMRRLLDALEPVPDYVCWLFTVPTDANDAVLFDDDNVVKSKDHATFISRCVRVELARRGLAEPFARFAQQVAIAEGLDGQPIDVYLRRIKDRRNNLRDLLGDIEIGDMLD